MMPRKLRMMLLLFVWLLMLGLGWLLLGGLMAPPSRALPMLSLPDVAVYKYKVSGVFAPGNQVKYEIYFINQGGYVANDVRIVDTLPVSTTYVTSSQPGFVLIQAGPDQVVWVRDRVSVFERGWLSITVRVDDDAPVGAWVENTAYILCLDPETNYDNNEYTYTEIVLPPQPDLTVRKELNPDSTVGPANQITYTIRYQNRGGQAAHNVLITDTLPLSVSYLSDQDFAGFTTIVTGSSMVWTKALVEAEESGHMDLVAKVSDDFDASSDWLENVLEISTSDPETNYHNNLNRYVWKPEPTMYGAAVTSVDDKTMRLLNDGGFDWMLYYLDWSETEPQDNQYYWRDLDDAVWKAWWYHLNLVVRVDRAPAWARPGKGTTAPPDNPAKLGEFLQAVAGRWPRQPGEDAPQIHGYVIWNEPNLASEWGGNPPDVAGYTALLTSAYSGVKASSATAWVISAGLAPTGDDPPNAVDDLSFLQAIYTAGAGSYFDKLGVNPMGFGYAPDDTSDPNGYNFSRALAWRQIMLDNGDSAKEMFAAEMGWLRDTAADLDNYNWMKVSDADQAHYLARAYHKARREWAWMGPMMLWNMDFAAHYPEAEHPHWFSVTGADGDPHRAYLTLKNAATGGPADLWLEKELISQVEPGQNLVYVIHYTNIGGQPAIGVVMTDTLPTDTEYVSDTSGGTPVTDGQVVWNIGSVDTGARETITLTLHLADNVSPEIYFENMVEASALPGEPYTDDNVAVAGRPLPDLSIHKSVAPDAAVPGDSIAYTLVFGNAGEDTAEGVVISDVVPISVTVQSVVSSGVTITDTGASPAYVWQLQDLDPDQSGIITVTGVLSSELPSGHAFTNTAVITGTTLDINMGNNRSWAEVTALSTLSIAKTVDPHTDVAYHSPVTYTLVLSNSGSTDAEGVLVTDTLPAEVDFAYWLAQPGGAEVSDDEITWSGVLTADQAITYTFVVSHIGSYGDLVSNSAEFSHPDSASGDSDEASFTVVGPPALSIEKTVEPDTDVAYQAQVTYTVVLSNSGPPDASGTLLTDTLPSQVDFDRWLEQPGGASVYDDQITWSGTLTAGQAITFSFVVSHVGSQGWPVANTASYSHISGSGSDQARFTVEGGGYIYLPIVLKDFVQAPDLVVDELIATGSAVTVTIRNAGVSAVVDEFWVDVYFDPSEMPTLNHPWDTIADYGVAWGVTKSLSPGESLSLTNDVTDPYYFPEYSSTPPLPVGANVYALVDSVNYSTSYGMVYESGEDNNLRGPVVSIAGVGGVVVPSGGPISTQGLPER